MDIGFIDDEYVKALNNKLERGHYKASKEEYRKWYLNMPNQRAGDLYCLVRFLKKGLK